MGGSHYFFHHRLLIAANMFSADFSKRLAPMATTRKKRAFIVTRQLLEITMKKTTLYSQYQKTWQFNRSFKKVFLYLFQQRAVVRCTPMHE